MKKLKELVNCEYDIDVLGIKTNSKNVTIGDVFVCTDMGTLDRHNFIDDAISNGAVAIIAKKDVGKKTVPVIIVDDPNTIFTKMCAKFYDYPNSKLKIYGVTGTDGKTSVATIISTLLPDTGYIGTNGITCKYFQEKTLNTTPDADKLYYYFDQFVKNDIKNVSLEVSSESLMRGRVREINFDVSIMTNITKEHLNIHGTLEKYISDKCELFRKCKKDGYCVLNIDDEHYLEVLNNCNGKPVTYGSKETADLYFYDVKLFPDKTLFKIKYQDNVYNIESPLIAKFNVYNLSAAILALLVTGYQMKDIVKNIHNIKISGRLQNIELGQDFKLFIDYAHTPNGIANLLEFANSLPKNKLIVVFSEPGERDATKRPEKGYNVITNCDHAIITSQDPRDEDPNKIVSDLLTLVKDKANYEIILDRSLAIKKAIDMAKKNDLVLIIGKGSETYQIFKDKTIYFSDIEEATKHLKDRLAKITN